MVFIKRMQNFPHVITRISCFIYCKYFHIVSRCGNPRGSNWKMKLCTLAPFVTSKNYSNWLLTVIFIIQRLFIEFAENCINILAELGHKSFSYLSLKLAKSCVQHSFQLQEDEKKMYWATAWFSIQKEKALHNPVSKRWYKYDEKLP